MNEEQELQLFERYISATMEQGDKETLKELLRHPESSRRFAEFIEDTAIYVSVAEDMDVKDCAVKIQQAKSFQQNASLKVTKRRTRKSSGSKNSKTAMRVLLSVAAAFVISGVLFFQYLKDNKQIGFADVAGISLERGGFDYTWGEKNILLDGDSFTALEDTAISLKDGSSLLMTKGAVCKVSNTSKGLLVEQLSGRVEYEVAKQVEGFNFRVKTNKLRTTVIGTQFTVDAESEESKVRVLEGLVKVDDLISKSYFVNPGEFAVINDDQELTKTSALKAMQLAGLLKDSQGNEFNTESLENKKFFLLLYVDKNDPAGRAFILDGLSKFYAQNNGDFEVIFMNDKDGFAKEYDMPWTSVKDGALNKAENVLGKFGDMLLSLTLIDQAGNVIARSHKGQEWHGTDSVLDALEDNLD